MCTHYPEPTVATNKGRHGQYVLTLITLINVVFHTHSILNTPYIEPLSLLRPDSDWCGEVDRIRRAHTRKVNCKLIWKKVIQFSIVLKSNMIQTSVKVFLDNRYLT